MDARAEIARAWDLFRLGALAEADLLMSRFPADQEAVRVRLWVAARQGDDLKRREFGAWLAANADKKLAPVGRAYENVALAALNLPLEPWLPPTTNWAKAEVAYARGVVAFIGDEPGRVRDELAAALPKTSEQRVRYAALRAWIHGLHEDFQKQATFLLHALSLAISEDVDRALVSNIANAIAPLVRELDLGELGDRAQALLETVEWPTDQTAHRFYTQRAVAWRHALGGNWIPAMHLLDGALAIAPDSARRGLIFADRARISRAADESLSAASSLENAFECFEEIAWERAGSEEATGVFAAIDVLAADMERARALFGSADIAKVSKTVGLGHGRRPIAFREFALSHLTDGEEALEHVRVAYKIFKELKYVHRATSCALRAVELRGGARWAERAERLVAEYPRSLAARQYERLTAPISRIRGRRLEVATLLVSTDKTAREIGEVLGMAEGTVRVHIKHINKLLNIENRSQLVRLFLEAHTAA